MYFMSKILCLNTGNLCLRFSAVQSDIYKANMLSYCYSLCPSLCPVHLFHVFCLFSALCLLTAAFQKILIEAFTVTTQIL